MMKGGDGKCKHTEGRKIYRRFNNRLRIEADQAKTIWWNELGRSDLLYAIVQAVCGEKKRRKRQENIFCKEGVQMRDQMSLGLVIRR